MNILITGGAGYIGSVLTPMALQAGHHVTVLDDFRYSQLSLAGCMHYSKLKIVVGDARDLRALMAAGLQTADVIIALAAIVGAPACDRDPTSAETINRDAIYQLLSRCDEEQIIIYPNTNSGYGATKYVVNENSLLRPISLYGRLKCEAEHAVIGHGGTSLRLATVFGMSPRMRLDLLVNDFVHRATRDHFLPLYQPQFIRSVVHVRDVARAFLHALDRADAMRGRAYNVVSGNVSKLNLCEITRRQVPDLRWTIIDQEDPDQRDAAVSSARIAETGFQPIYTLDQGITELIRGLAPLSKYQYGNI